MRKRSKVLFDDDLEDQENVMNPFNNPPEEVKPISLTQEETSNSVDTSVNSFIKKSVPPVPNYLENNYEMGDGKVDREKVDDKVNNSMDKENENLLILKNKEGRKKSIPFSKKEVEYLISKEKEFGPKWTQILRMGKNENVFDSKRNHVDLKQKMNLINKSSSYYKTPSRSWKMVQIDENPLLDPILRESKNVNKFPYDAAKHFVYNELLLKKESYTLTISEVGKVDKTYKYLVDASDSSHIIIKKVP